MTTRLHFAVIIAAILTFYACERVDPVNNDDKEQETVTPEGGENDKEDTGEDNEGKPEGGDGKEEGGDNGSGEGNGEGEGEEGGDNGNGEEGSGDGNGGDGGKEEGGDGNDGDGKEEEGGDGEGGGNGNEDEGSDFQWEAGTYFVSGVTKESGWYDVNKKRDGQSDGDFLLCWAAASANVLQWWQDRYKAAGYTLPAGTPDGEGEYYELDIFEDGIKPYFPDQGNDTFVCIHWYFTGEDKAENYYGYPHPASGSGGYFKDSFSGIMAELGGDAYCQEITGYSIWGRGKSDSRDPLVIWSELVKNQIRQGALTMTIRPGVGTLHGVTLWGFDLNEDGVITSVYMTDSDDQMSTPDAPRQKILHHFNVSTGNGTVKLMGHFSGDVEITSITFLKEYPSKGK